MLDCIISHHVDSRAFLLFFIKFRIRTRFKLICSLYFLDEMTQSEDCDSLNFESIYSDQHVG